MHLGDPDCPGWLSELGCFLPRCVMVRKGPTYPARIVREILRLLLQRELGHHQSLTQRPDAGFRSDLSNSSGANPQPRPPDTSSRRPDEVLTAAVLDSRGQYHRAGPT
jgi:hypothetical protein